MLDCPDQIESGDVGGTKAGLVLGFAGVLIALGNDSASLPGFVSIVAAALAAATAVTAFWPRGFPSIDPRRLGEYAVSDIAFTKLTVLDTLEVMLVETGRVLDSKSRRLKLALVSLTAAAVLTAVELIVRWP